MTSVLFLHSNAADYLADSLLPGHPFQFSDPDPERARLLQHAYANPQGISGNGTVNTRAWRESM